MTNIRRHLIEQYKQCKSSEDITQTQERLLKELEEDYGRSRDTAGMYETWVQDHSSLVKSIPLDGDGDDLLVPNPNHQHREEEDEESEDDGESLE